MSVAPIKHLTYSTGPRGSHRLRSAAAEFWNREFHPPEILTMDNIFVTPGVASAIDAMAWAVCNEGDGIFIPLPLYNGFVVDLANRSNVRVIGITYEGIEGYSGLDDVFLPDVNRRAVERALHLAGDRGVTPRALLISKLVALFAQRRTQLDGINCSQSTQPPGKMLRQFHTHSFTHGCRCS